MSLQDGLFLSDVPLSQVLPLSSMFLTVADVTLRSFGHPILGTFGAYNIAGRSGYRFGSSTSRLGYGYAIIGTHSS